MLTLVRITKLNYGGAGSSAAGGAPPPSHSHLTPTLHQLCPIICLCGAEQDDNDDDAAAALVGRYNRKVLSSSQCPIKHGNLLSLFLFSETDPRAGGGGGGGGQAG